MKKMIIIVMTGLIGIGINAQTASEDLFILGGELSNSAATSVEDIDEVIPRMKVLGLNTVLVPIYWEFLEPVEGQMDFTLTDRIIDEARQEGLKIVPLWFGAWKNSMSCYAPAWFKCDVKRFPRAVTKDWKPLEIASCFSDNILQADLKAFSALMQHIAEKDPQREVVIMMQIENANNSPASRKRSAYHRDLDYFVYICANNYLNRKDERANKYEKRNNDGCIDADGIGSGSCTEQGISDEGHQS